MENGEWIMDNGFVGMEHKPFVHTDFPQRIYEKTEIFNTEILRRSHRGAQRFRIVRYLLSNNNLNSHVLNNGLINHILPMQTSRFPIPKGFRLCRKAFQPPLCVLCAPP